MNYPAIDVWRMSASRPWQLRKTSQSLFERLKYSGELRYHLIESVLVKDLSDRCVRYAKSLGYQTHVIEPQRGQGFAIQYALDNVITTPYALKWEDDFKAEKDIPLDICIGLMEKYPHINQICFNKRETMSSKRCRNERGEIFQWQKEQRYFELDGQQIPLVVKEKWWFGTALWRISYIKPKFRWWESNTHNLMNDLVLLPLARELTGVKVPLAPEIEKTIGCYIYGKTADPRMVEHTGLGDSLWKGELQERWRKEGKNIL